MWRFCTRGLFGTWGIVVAVGLCGCGTVGGPIAPVSAPIPIVIPGPVLQQVIPAAVQAGSTGVLMTVAGENFVPASLVTWNGSGRAATYVSSTALQLQLAVGDVANAGTVQVAVLNPGRPQAQSSNSLPFQITARVAVNPVPELTTLSQTQALAGASGFALTLTGSNFTTGATAYWNGLPLSTTFDNGTTLTAQVGAALLAGVGQASVTVANPGPGGGSSNAVPFQIVAPATGSIAELAISVIANDLAWDAVSQRIYLSLPSLDGANGNSLETLDPVAGLLGSVVPVGSEPNLVSVSSTGKYLYVALDGAGTVQRLNLPGLSQDASISLGGDPYAGPYQALDLQAAPNGEDQTFAVTLRTKRDSVDSVGVLVVEGATAQPLPACPVVNESCITPFLNGFDSIQWNGDGTQLFAGDWANSNASLYVIPVSGGVPGAATDYVSVLGYPPSAIHYDGTTKLIYDETGEIVDPATGKNAGQFATSGLMVPDGKLGKVFFLYRAFNAASNVLTLSSFDINTHALIGSVQVTGVVGEATHLIRWGTNGLAFTTTGTSTATLLPEGMVYVLSGAFVSGS